MRQVIHLPNAWCSKSDRTEASEISEHAMPPLWMLMPNAAMLSDAPQGLWISLSDQEKFSFGQPSKLQDFELFYRRIQLFN